MQSTPPPSFVDDEATEPGGSTGILMSVAGWILLTFSQLLWGLAKIMLGVAWFLTKTSFDIGWWFVGVGFDVTLWFLWLPPRFVLFLISSAAGAPEDAVVHGGAAFLSIAAVVWVFKGYKLRDLRGRHVLTVLGVLAAISWPRTALWLGVAVVVTVPLTALALQIRDRRERARVRALLRARTVRAPARPGSDSRGVANPGSLRPGQSADGGIPTSTARGSAGGAEGGASGSAPAARGSGAASEANLRDGGHAADGTTGADGSVLRRRRGGPATPTVNNPSPTAIKTFLEEECPICFEDWESIDESTMPKRPAPLGRSASEMAADELHLKNVKVLHCGHVYHTHCIADWLERESRCPVCQVRVTRVGRLIESVFVS